MLKNKKRIFGLFTSLLALTFLFPGVGKAVSIAGDCKASLYFAVTETNGKQITELIPAQIGSLSVVLYMKVDFNDAAKCDTSTWSSVTAFRGFDALVKDANQFIGNGVITAVSPTQYEVKQTITTSNLPDTLGAVPKAGSKIQLRGFINLRDASLRDNFVYSATSTISVTGSAPSGAPTPSGATETPSTTPSPTFTPGVIATIQNPIPFNSLGELLVAAIRFILTMLGALAVFFIIVGAVKMVTSQGNEKNITSGKQTIQWAVIGLIVALMSFSVIALVQSFLQRQ